MRAWVDTLGNKGLVVDEFYIVKSILQDGRRCLLDDGDVRMEVESPGWPVGSEVEVLLFDADKKTALLELVAAAAAMAWKRKQQPRGLLARLAARAADKYLGMEQRESDMTGKIWEGVVVHTSEGEDDCKEKSTIVYATAEPFIAKSQQTASSIVFAAALKKNPDLVADEVEVQVREWNTRS